MVDKQFILMGSPGTGKSCILALICIYIAVVYDRPVVWFRQVGGGWGSQITTRLFYQGKYYKWEDSEGENYENLYEYLKVVDNVKTCWSCLTGMPQCQIVKKRWFNRFRMLATSGQFTVKSEGAEFTEFALYRTGGRRIWKV
ncbi:hypothetical protein V7S43_010553 [Phytophthora oleae]|uniref:Uncharacterized protein n=1 Tax=Phytophthora oleae TaxID=2107226 RepID=A0ABD3FFD1_9STRA